MAKLAHNLSVLLIAHNEEENIGKMISGLLETYDREILEIVVVDDASRDKTAEIVSSWSAKNPKVRLIQRVPPCGVGRALKTGFKNLNPRAAYVLSMDSDFIENIPQIRSLLNALEKNHCDGVIGSRFVEGGKLVGYPGSKKLMNRLFHLLVRSMFRIRQKDLTNNFKLYKTEIVKTMQWKNDAFGMNAETGIYPIISGYTVLEVPVYWINRSPEMGQSKFGLLKQGGGYMKVIIDAIGLKFFGSRKVHV